MPLPMGIHTLPPSGISPLRYSRLAPPTGISGAAAQLRAEGLLEQQGADAPRAPEHQRVCAGCGAWLRPRAATLSLYILVLSFRAQQSIRGSARAVERGYGYEPRP